MPRSKIFYLEEIVSEGGLQILLWPMGGLESQKGWDPQWSRIWDQGDFTECWTRFIHFDFSQLVCFFLGESEWTAALTECHDSCTEDQRVRSGFFCLFSPNPIVYPIDPRVSKWWPDPSLQRDSSSKDKKFCHQDYLKCLSIQWKSIKQFSKYLSLSSTKESHSWGWVCFLPSRHC